jgi:hypothetical protein
MRFAGWVLVVLSPGAAQHSHAPQPPSLAKYAELATNRKNGWELLQPTHPPTHLPAQATLSITYQGLDITVSGQFVLEQLGIDGDNFVLDMATLAAWVVVFLLMGLAVIAAGLR